MTSKIIKPNYLAVVVAIVAISVVRILFPGVQESLGGFTPIFAVAIFGSAVLYNRWLAVLIPLAIMFISDLAINLLHYNYGFFYSGMIYTYLIYLAMIVVSMFIMNKITVTRVASASIVAVLMHWVCTSILYTFGKNAIDVLTGKPIGPDMHGIIVSHTQAIPFELRLLAGTLLYSALFFGIYYTSTKMALQSRLATKKI
jgi:hypothetical protein